MRHEEIMLTICLEIPASGRKMLQDPDFTPGDARFLARLGFEIVMDPVGLNAINEGDLGLSSWWIQLPRLASYGWSLASCLYKNGFPILVLRKSYRNKKQI